MCKRPLVVSIFAAALWSAPLYYFGWHATTPLNAAEGQTQSPSTPGSQSGKASKPGAVAKLPNILFQRAQLVAFAGGQIWARESGPRWRIDVYNRKDGKPHIIIIDWHTRDISEPELKQIAAYKSCCSLRVNGTDRPIQINKIDKSRVSTIFEVSDSSWPLSVQLRMNPPPPAERLSTARPGKAGATAKKGDQKKAVVDRRKSAGKADAVRKGDPKGDLVDAGTTVDKVKEMAGPKYASAPIEIAADRFDFFERYLYPTFQHARCTTCHLMGSSEAIIAQHSSDGVPGHGHPDDPTTCSNCHGDVRAAKEINTKTAAKFLGQLGNFTDYTWRSPAFAKNINWKTKVDARDVCMTVVSHLSTAEKLFKHFHNDARIAWAVSAGDVYFSVGGGVFGTKESAPPKSFTKFLARIDKWVMIGFPCQ